MRVEVFSDSNVGDVKYLVNLWLSEHPNVIIQDKMQSQSDGRFVISIWYTEIKEAESEPASLEG